MNEWNKVNIRCLKGKKYKVSYMSLNKYERDRLAYFANEIIKGFQSPIVESNYKNPKYKKVPKNVKFVEVSMDEKDPDLRITNEAFGYLESILSFMSRSSIEKIGCLLFNDSIISHQMNMFYLVQKKSEIFNMSKYEKYFYLGKEGYNEVTEMLRDFDGNAYSRVVEDKNVSKEKIKLFKPLFPTYKFALNLKGDVKVKDVFKEPLKTIQKSYLNGHRINLDKRNRFYFENLQVMQSFFDDIDEIELKKKTNLSLPLNLMAFNKMSYLIDLVIFTKLLQEHANNNYSLMFSMDKKGDCRLEDISELDYKYLGDLGLATKLYIIENMEKKDIIGLYGKLATRLKQFNEKILFEMTPLAVEQNESDNFIELKHYEFINQKIIHTDQYEQLKKIVASFVDMLNDEKSKDSIANYFSITHKTIYEYRRSEKATKKGRN